jgi:hypothetical protein
MKEKMITQMKVSGVQTQSELQKLSTKIFYNIINFIYHYFFIIGIFLIIGYYLYKRYVWYQQIKKIQIVEQEKKELQDEQMKKYFDNIMDGKNQSQSIHQPIHQPIHTQNQNKFQQQAQAQAYFVPGKKLDKVISGNNGYLNHMKNIFDTTVAHTSSMGRIQPNSDLGTKSVRFAQGDFDAFGRNSLNPKTGETLVKQSIIPEYNEQNQVQAYDSKPSSSFSSF